MSAFTPAGSGGIPQSVSVSGATTPLIAHVSMPSAATEYSYTLPTGTKQFLLLPLDLTTFQVAFVSGQSATNYIPLGRGVHYGESSLSLSSSKTIYFQSPDAAMTAVILYWT